MPQHWNIPSFKIESFHKYWILFFLGEKVKIFYFKKKKKKVITFKPCLIKHQKYFLRFNYFFLGEIIPSNQFLLPII